jgi:hypothetical protein
MTTYREVTEADTEKIEPDPGIMQSVGEHQEVPKEEAMVMLVRGLRKRCRDQNLGAGHHQKPKGRTQASCESQKRLTFASRKIDDPLCKSGMVKERSNQEARGMRSLESVRGREETVEVPGMQNWNK